MKIVKKPQYYLFTNSKGATYHMEHAQYVALGKKRAIAFVKAELDRKSLSSSKELQILSFDKCRDMGFCSYGIEQFSRALKLDITKEYTVKQVFSAFNKCNKKVQALLLKEYACEILQIFSDVQTHELCLAAVTQNGWALEYVKRQDKDICLAAVTQNGLSLKFVKKQDKDICLAAVTQNGYALRYVKKQDRELSLAAVTKYGWALYFVNKQDKELCLAAVTQNGLALKFVKKQDKDICLAAVTRYGYALKYVEKQDKDICLAAVKQDRGVIMCIKCEKLKKELIK